jgi:Mg2+ and Co2+ transporter CorA
MNVWVPGQGDENNLTWFYAMCAFFALFVLVTWFVAKRVYHLV